MTTIYKYPIEITAEQKVQMPFGAEVIRALFGFFHRMGKISRSVAKADA